MIENIAIKNFKSLKNISMKTKSLNLLMGLNGMGKSSLLQCLLLLKQSNNLYKRELRLDGNLINIGKGKDAFYQFADDDNIIFKIHFSNNKNFSWEFQYKPEYKELKAKSGYTEEDLKVFTEAINSFQYITADRLGPQEIYDTHQGLISENQIGEKGEYTVHFLNVYGNSIKVPPKLKHDKTEDLTLINQVNGWLGEISPGVKLNIMDVPHVDKILLNYQFELKKGNTTTFKPINVGFGISFVLPIVVSLLLPMKNKIIILENPESHIHPRGQAELGKLMALSAASGAQLFIETHSDHLINGVRVAVKERNINKKDVSISYFDKITTEKEQYSRITNISVDNNGELSDYPKDFMDEWSDQLLKLL
jgi:predicted ATPase